MCKCVFVCVHASESVCACVRIRVCKKTAARVAWTSFSRWAPATLQEDMTRTHTSTDTAPTHHKEPIVVRFTHGPGSQGSRSRTAPICGLRKAPMCGLRQTPVCPCLRTIPPTPNGPETPVLSCSPLPVPAMRSSPADRHSYARSAPLPCVPIPLCPVDPEALRSGRRVGRLSTQRAVGAHSS